MPLLAAARPDPPASHSSITARYGPSFGAGLLTGARFAGGTGDANACFTVRRCTPCRTANPRIERPSRSRSRLICSNCSTLDPIPSGASRSSSMKRRTSAAGRTEVGPVQDHRSGASSDHRSQSAGQSGGIGPSSKDFIANAAGRFEGRLPVDRELGLERRENSRPLTDRPEGEHMPTKATARRPQGRRQPAARLPSSSPRFPAARASRPACDRPP